MSSMPTAECPRATTVEAAPPSIRAWAAGGDLLFAFHLPRPTMPIAGLSSAESDVVRGAILALSNADIARARATSARTVANQIARAFVKLRVSGRAELLARMAALCGADGSSERPGPPDTAAGVSMAEATELDRAAAREGWHALLVGRIEVHAMSDANETRYVLARPSRRERPATWARAPRIAQLAARGLSNKQIAMELGVAESLVSRTVTALIRRLGLRSRFDLAAVAASL